MMEKIIVLFGGDSPERDVSIVSGNEVAAGLSSLGFDAILMDPIAYPALSDLLEAIKRESPKAVFNALHGGKGENGLLTAALSLAGVSFTGSGFKAMCIAMDKHISKLLAQAEGIPIAKSILLRGDALADYQDPNDYSGIVNILGLPLIVKPNDAGSSVGIELVKTLEDLKPAVSESLKYCNKVLLEEYIEGKELTVTVLKGKALPVVEIKPKDGWYDYKNKYTKGNTEYIVPAPIEEGIAHLTQIYAEKIYQAMGCETYSRIDFRLKENTPYFLEVNTLPGMTPLSLTPMAAKAAGISFTDLLIEIIN
jgi:D-alanine-D-alanine ligase